MPDRAIAVPTGMKGEKMKAFVFAVAAALAALATPVLAQTPTPVQSMAPPPAATAADPEVEVAFWRSVENSDDPMLYLAYLDQYPDGAFRVIARNRLEELWRRAVRAFALLDELGVALDDPQATLPAPAPSAQAVVKPPVVVQTPSAGVKAQPTLNRIRNTQRQLKRHGCYFGAVDGIWGVGSKAAMRRYNRQAGTKFSVMQPNIKALTHMRELTKAGVKVCR